MTQALEFMTGGFLNGKVGDRNGRVSKWIAAKLPKEKVVEEVYILTLGRLPTASEIETACLLLKTAPSAKEGYEDLLWTMLNLREFQFCH